MGTMQSLILGSLVLAESPLKFDLLKTSRTNITVLPYTLQEKLVVADAVEKMMSVYVHRHEKTSYYGKERPDIDPIPRAAAIKAKAANLTDKEFHDSYSELYMSLRDFHTNYYYPVPHSCYRAYTAVKFQMVESANVLEPTVVVSGFSKYPEVIKLSGEDFQKISVGDELVSINGKSFSQYVAETQYTLGGANAFGAQRAALASLSVISGKYNSLPATDNVSFVLKGKETYTVKLPWISGEQEDCMKEYERRNSGAVFQPILDTRKIKYPRMTHPYLEEFKNAFGPEASNVTLHSTIEPKLQWAIFEPEKANMGIIKIEDFEPDDSSETRWFGIIGGLLTNELANTNSLLFDIRDNGGGSIVLADIIPQMFVANYVNGAAHALVHPLNKLVFESGIEGEKWKQAYEEVRSGDEFTRLVQFESNEQMNMMGQFYFKPVGILNNANCYSACDLFSANMQDNDAAWIFGEDGLSGAGGANVVEYTGYFANQFPDNFTQMPYKNKIPKFHQDLRVGWRQSIRVKKNEGKLIEDYGISSDTIVRPSLGDVIANSSTSQFERIAAKLAEIGNQKGTSNLFFIANPSDMVSVNIGSPINFELTSSDIKTVSLNTEKGQVLKTIEIEQVDKKTSNVLSAVVPGTFPGYARYQLTALNPAGKQVVETFRVARLLPLLTSYRNFTLSSYEWDADTSGPGVGLFNLNTDEANGWIGKNGTLIVGNGIKYKDNVNTAVSLFFNPTETVVLKIKAKYDTEKGYDFLYIGYTDANSTVQLLNEKGATEGTTVSGVSGNGTIDQTFNFKPNGRFEVFFKFVSDSGASSKGVSIESVTFSR